MSSIRRSSVRAGSALAALILAFALPLSARADDASHLWFGGTRLIFDRAVETGGEIAVATSDAGLARFLGRVGATLAYDPAQRNVIITAADRRVIRFTVGDVHYAVASALQLAPFAPYGSGNDAFLPFLTLAHALGVEPVREGGEVILQPQLYALETKAAEKSVMVIVRTATPIRFSKVDDASRMIVSMSGVSSSLEQNRTVASPALTSIEIIPGGTARGPTTSLTFDMPAGAGRSMLPSSSPNEAIFVFSGPGLGQGGSPVPSTYAATAPLVMPVTIAGRTAPTLPAGRTAPSAALQAPAPAPSIAPGAPAGPGTSTPATVTAVDETAVGDGLNVRIGVTGGATYEWHRLIDNRFYVDVKNAILGFAARDDAPPSPGVPSLRIRQIATYPIPVVRIALTLGTQRQIDVINADSGLVVAVNAADDVAPPRSGAGEVNGGIAYAPPAVAPLPLPQMLRGNGRTIVIDPGHGGSDTGASHNGLVEKNVTLDISRRLKTILISRGWSVRMTRETDVDVYAPNDSARDELQARVDVANEIGARLFVSIHINSSTAASVNGTTTYYYKQQDYGLASAIHRRLMSTLGTADMGVRKEAFYVIKHTSMPATLVETAFISNAADAELMRSPEFLQRVASSIADGIADYAVSTPATSAAQ